MGRQAKLKRSRKEEHLLHQLYLEQSENRNTEIDNYLIDLSMILVPKENYLGYLDSWSNLKNIDKSTAFRLAAEIYLALEFHLAEENTESKIIKNRRIEAFRKWQKAWISVGTHLLLDSAKDYIPEEEILKIPDVKKHVEIEPYKHIKLLSDMLLALHKLIEGLHRKEFFNREMYPSHNFPWLLAVGAITNQMLFESGVLTGSTSPYFPKQHESRSKKKIRKTTLDYFDHLADADDTNNPPNTKTAQNLAETVAHFDKVLEFYANKLASKDEEFNREFWTPYVKTRTQWVRQIQKPYFTILDASELGDRKGRRIGSKNKN
jgi:hypothetical protein